MSRLAKALRYNQLANTIHVHGPHCPCHAHSFLGQTKFVQVRNVNRQRKSFSTTRKSASIVYPTPEKPDYAFEMASSTIRFGVGATKEVGLDVADWGAKNVCVVCDPILASIPNSPVHTVLKSLTDARVKFQVFSKVRVEPTDSSFKEAIEFAKSNGPFDAFIGVGGGSTLDTAKAANLYSSFPNADFLDFVNAPVGKGLPVPGPIKPFIAIPTTAGSGSETTGVAIFDMESMHAKTGIASRVIKPTIGIVDPLNTLSLPRAPTIASALDQLCHSIESYTALPYNLRPLPDRPALRPAYQGSNPISDVWSLKSLGMIAENLPTVISNPGDLHARSQLMLAATYAGIGFGNAGVHLCHGMSYAVSGLVRPHVKGGEGYPDRPLIPHGMSVCINAPAVFKFTGLANPDRHREVANILSGKSLQVADEDAGKYLSDSIITLMGKLDVPLGLKAFGYTREDIPKLVEGTLPQHRVIKLSPRPVERDDLTALFESAMSY